jgi:hypothetical protein
LLSTLKIIYILQNIIPCSKLFHLDVVRKQDKAWLWTDWFCSISPVIILVNQGLGNPVPDKEG